jgi:hypothetical protein
MDEREVPTSNDDNKEFRKRRKAVSEMRFYYQEFHHKCMTWYITSMGFFLAGMIASSSRPSKLLGAVAIAFTVFLGAVFFHVIVHYGGRIAGLNAYLAHDCAAIPKRLGDAEQAK